MRASFVCVVVTVVFGLTSSASARYPIVRRPMPAHAALPWSTTPSEAIAILTRLDAHPTGGEVVRRYVAGAPRVEHHDLRIVRFELHGWSGRAAFLGEILASVTDARTLTAAQRADELAALEARFGERGRWGDRLTVTVSSDGRFEVVYRR